MRPQHVLVLDRDLARAQALAATLRAAGHQVLTLTDPAEAASGLRAGGVELLVLDLALPTLDLPALRGALAPGTPPPEPLDAAERRHIAHVLQYTGGNKRQAAHLLGISRSTLLNKIRRYGIE